MVDIGGDRYVVLAHLEQGSVMVQVVMWCGGASRWPRSGTPGHTNEPHLHLQVQDTSTGKENADRTYPWCSPASTSAGAVPGRSGDSRVLLSPATSSNQAVMMTNLLDFGEDGFKEAVTLAPAWSAKNARALPRSQPR